MLTPTLERRNAAQNQPTAASNSEIEVEIGMMGFSVEDIAAGDKGFCMMPLGPRDSTKAGGRKWVKIKLTAMEDVRANIEVIVANEYAQIKEWVVIVTIPQLPNALTSAGTLAVSVPEMTGVLTTFFASFISAPPIGKIINSITLTYDANGLPATAVFIESTPGVYTLTFTWVLGRLVNVTRT